MSKLFTKVFSAAVVVAASLPLPAGAEMYGAAACANASWNEVLAGECGIGDMQIAQPLRDGGADSTTQLVTEVPGIPEPETYALMLVGLVAVIVAARRRRGA